ncbi:MAG: tetratricopeptide repeat protein [Bacteroidia bacterium]|nr:tetratricopeptide repeat protein [Bacteroidia bacterium]
MKKIAVTVIIWAMVLCLFYSCKSGKTSKSKKKISYNSQKLFNSNYYEGSKQKILGNYNEALKEFKSALDILPQHHETMYQIGNIYLKLNKIEEAKYWSLKALKLNKSYNFWYYEQLIKIYNINKEYNESSELYSTIIKKEPSRKEVYEKAAEILEYTENYEEAANYLKTYIELFGPEEDACKKLSKYYDKLYKHDEACKILKLLSDTYPSNTKFLGLLAELQVKYRYFNEARFTYYKILKYDENNGYAFFGLADIFKKTKNEDSSFYFLCKGFENNKINIQHKVKVISSYYFLMIKDETSKNRALELAKKLITAHPTEAVSFQVYSDMLVNVEEYNEARIYLKKSLEIEANDYRYWQKLFAIDVKLKNNEYLYEDSKKALELFTTQPGLYIINSSAAFRTERYDEAINICNMGLDISFKDTEKNQLYLTLADCWYGKKNIEKTDFYFKKAIETLHNNSLALNNYAYNLYKRNEKLDKAEEMVLKAIELEPSSASFADTYACILMAKNNLDEAEKWFKKALVTEPESAEILEHLGDLYVKKNNSELAIETYKKALKNDPENKSLKNKLQIK